MEQPTFVFGAGMMCPKEQSLDAKVEETAPAALLSEDSILLNILQRVELKQRLSSCSLLSQRFRKAAAQATGGTTSITAYVPSDSPEVFDSFASWLQSYGQDVHSIRLIQTGPVKPQPPQEPGKPFHFVLSSFVFGYSSNLPCPDLTALELKVKYPEHGGQLHVQLFGQDEASQQRVGLLQACSKLTSLRLQNADIKDMTAESRNLSGLTALVEPAELSITYAENSKPKRAMPAEHLSVLTALTLLRLEGWTFKHYQYLSCLTNLRFLHITDYTKDSNVRDGRVVQAGMPAAGMDCLQRLTYLSLAWESNYLSSYSGLLCTITIASPSGFSQLTGLHHLCVTNCRLFQPKVLQKMQQLTALHLHKVQLLDGAYGTSELLSVLPKLQKLQQLELQGTLQHTATTVQKYSSPGMVSFLQRLQQLALDSCLLPPGMWQQLQTAGLLTAQLQHLSLNNLQGERKLGSAELAALAACCPGLQVLQLVGSLGAGADLSVLCTLPLLGWLWVSKVGDAAGLGQLRTLQLLSVGHPNSLTAGGIAYLVHLKALTHLVVACQEHAYGAAFEDLYQGERSERGFQGSAPASSRTMLGVVQVKQQSMDGPVVPVWKQLSQRLHRCLNPDCKAEYSSHNKHLAAQQWIVSNLARYTEGLQRSQQQLVCAERELGNADGSSMQSLLAAAEGLVEAMETAECFGEWERKVLHQHAWLTSTAVHAASGMPAACDQSGCAHGKASSSIAQHAGSGHLVSSAQGTAGQPAEDQVTAPQLLTTGNSDSAAAQQAAHDLQDRSQIVTTAADVFAGFPAVLENVLRFVPLQDRMQACALVSTAMRRAANAACMSIQLHTGSLGADLKFMAWLYQHGTQLTALWYHPSTALELQRSLPCARLQQLTLDGANMWLYPTPRSGCPGALNACSLLTSLALHSCSIWQPWEELASLTALSNLQNLSIADPTLLEVAPTAGSTSGSSSNTGQGRMPDSNRRVNFYNFPRILMRQLLGLTRLRLAHPMAITATQDLSYLTGLRELHANLALGPLAASNPGWSDGLLQLKQVSSLALEARIYSFPPRTTASCNAGDDISRQEVAEAGGWLIHGAQRLTQGPDLQALTQLQQLWLTHFKLPHTCYSTFSTQLQELWLAAFILQPPVGHPDSISATVAFFEALPRLESLTKLGLLDSIGTNRDMKKLDAAGCTGLFALQHLRHLHLEFTHLPAGFWQLLHGPATTQGGVGMPAWPQHLTTLNLFCTGDKLSTHDVMLLARGCGQAQAQNGSCSRDSQSEAGSCHYPGLLELSLSLALEPIFDVSALSGFTSLTSLILHEDCVNDAAIQQLISQHQGRLRRLQLKAYTKVTDLVVLQLTVLTSLTHLSVASRGGLSEAFGRPSSQYTLRGFTLQQAECADSDSQQDTWPVWKQLLLHCLYSSNCQQVIMQQWDRMEGELFDCFRQMASTLGKLLQQVPTTPRLEAVHKQWMTVAQAAEEAAQASVEQHVPNPAEDHPCSPGRCTLRNTHVSAHTCAQHVCLLHNLAAAGVRTLMHTCVCNRSRSLRQACDCHATIELGNFPLVSHVCPFGVVHMCQESSKAATMCCYPETC